MILPMTLTSIELYGRHAVFPFSSYPMGDGGGGGLWLNWNREIIINLQEMLISFCFLSNVDWL